MNNQSNVFFFEIHQIPENSIFFDKLQEKRIYTESQIENQNTVDTTQSGNLLEINTESLKPLSRVEQSNLAFTQKKAVSGTNFRTFGQISNAEQIEIIQTGFDLNQKGKILLNKYYEGTETNSLFQLKGYRIKYEAIRKNKFYQQLKK